MGSEIVVGAVVTGKRVQAKLLAIKAPELKRQVYRFRNAIQGNSIDLERGAVIKAKNATVRPAAAGDGYKGMAVKLYQELIAPFGRTLNSSAGSHLCIVPHGVLHYLPFQTLASRETGKNRLLIEQFPLNYSPSASLLLMARKKNRQTRSHLLAAGSPPRREAVRLGSQSYPLAKLLFAEEEIRQVSTLFPGDPSYVDRRATETVVKKQAGKADVLLFSTHGILMRDDPLRSSLFFAPDSSNDGRLTVAEIEQLPTRANLVVLSACEAGLLSGRKGVSDNLADAIFPPGDDLFGLQRAFLGAGAGSVLSTLWSVADESTAALVIEFFQNYKVQGMDKAEALRAAQLHIMENPAWNHPFFWAPFILSGDWL